MRATDKLIRLALYKAENAKYVNSLHKKQSEAEWKKQQEEIIKKLKSLLEPETVSL